MTLQELGTSTYIALETYKKDGTGVVTPVWVAGENDKIYAWTEGNSWKVKRIRNNETVRVCASDSRGKPQSDWLEAKAQVLESPEDEAVMQKCLSKKYGFQFKLFYMMGRIRNRGGKHVVIEIS
jgi:hypothetical protein